MAVEFDEWSTLYLKYENSDFTDKSIREEFEKEFTSLSKEYLKGEYAFFMETDVDIFFELLSEVWCEYAPFVNREKPLEEQQDKIALAYKDALGTLFYASDRMNFNRWLHIRLRLNEGLD